MSSYIETIIPQMYDRGELVDQAVAKLRRIINAYTEVDAPGLTGPTRTRTEHRNAGSPQELMWFELFGHSGDSLKVRSVDDLTDVDRKVGSAALQVAKETNIRTAFTITMQPPNVIGYDGVPLAPNQIKGALEDLDKYEAALEQSGIATRVTV